MATNVEPSLLIGIAGTPPINIDLGLNRLLPLIVTKVPTGPLVPENEVILGGRLTYVKPGNESAPPGEVTLINPVFPAPTLASKEVGERIRKDAAAAPPSVIAETVLKLVPVIKTESPDLPVLGEKELIIGGGIIKLKPLTETLPPPAVIRKLPEDPSPTVERMAVEDRTVNVVAEVPPKEIF
jgi:hypothetical protein